MPPARGLAFFRAKPEIHDVGSQTVLILSDIHYACPAEQARGATELKAIKHPLLRLLVKAYRHFLWRRNPFAYNHLLDEFIREAEGADWVVANGDYTCDTAFVGISDDASFTSAQICLGKLRDRFNGRFYATMGDHELGKTSLIGRQGGVRLNSWTRAREELGLPSLWRLQIGVYTLVGIASTLVALPVFESELLPAERPEWFNIREQYLRDLRHLLTSLDPQAKLILFCHDPTALPYLWGDAVVQAALHQLEATVIGHLHSPLFFWKAKLLAGMPRIECLGPSVQRITSALCQAKTWKHFRLRLCPSLGGIQLLNDGGFLKMTVDPEGQRSLGFEYVRIHQGEAASA